MATAVTVVIDRNINVTDFRKCFHFKTYKTGNLLSRNSFSSPSLAEEDETQSRSAKLQKMETTQVKNKNFKNLKASDVSVTWRAATGTCAAVCCLQIDLIVMHKSDLLVDLSDVWQSDTWWTHTHTHTHTHSPNSEQLTWGWIQGKMMRSNQRQLFTS